MPLDASRLDPDTLIACPTCDLLHVRRVIPCGGTARCVRCHTVLIAPRRGAITLIVSLAIGALALMAAAVSAPFLSVEVSGLQSRASVVDSVTAFAMASGQMAPLSVLTALLIILLPLFRLVALVYALGPLALDRPPARYAAPVFRWAMRTKQWAMAEIFIIGVAVALIKVQSLATVHFGPAFWAFAGFVLLMAAKNTMICERSLWPLITGR